MLYSNVKSNNYTVVKTLTHVNDENNLNDDCPYELSSSTHNDIIKYSTNDNETCYLENNTHNTLCENLIEQGDANTTCILTMWVFRGSSNQRKNVLDA